MADYRFTTLCLTLGLLTACSHQMTQDECRHTNWKESGFNDGAHGKHAKDLRKDIRNCQRYNVAVDSDAYQSGHQLGVKSYCKPSYQVGLTDGQNGVPMTAAEGRGGFCQGYELALYLQDYHRGYEVGIQSYCTTEVGYRVGAEGKSNPHVCPDTLAGQFERGWRNGNRHYCSLDESAFNVGRNGGQYPSACPASIYPTYHASYQRGYMVYQRVSELKAKIASLDRKMERRKRLLSRPEESYEKKKRARQELLELTRLRADAEQYLFETETTRFI